MYLAQVTATTEWPDGDVDIGAHGWPMQIELAEYERRMSPAGVRRFTVLRVDRIRDTTADTLLYTTN
jgi:hypothetical protein